MLCYAINFVCMMLVMYNCHTYDTYAFSVASCHPEDSVTMVAKTPREQAFFLQQELAKLSSEAFKQALACSQLDMAHDLVSCLKDLSAAAADCYKDLGELIRANCDGEDEYAMAFSTAEDLFNEYELKRPFLMACLAQTRVGREKKK